MNFRTFFLAFLFLSFSSTEIIRNHDLSEVWAEFLVVITGHATGLILFTRWDIEHPECLLACVHHLKCKSVNYNQKIKICELLDTNVNENIISPQEDWVAISTTFSSEEESVNRFKTESNSDGLYFFRRTWKLQPVHK